ncbi:hypothetical protein ZYGR_0AK05820 [Zygosaccharomyces rouxii]|uniref:Homeobox domain-containing protein n=1 Tax=Zygosaccharomyces rouxii TaxID=4956 RepID=A0A1Q3AEK4_ZYGRO|nr:hypothetical protein ZYGR_0AK05820 [Zygosaccharomyces rouxii]
MSSEKPLLPSLAAILCNEKPNSEPCSPLLETMNTSFYSDSRGTIRLPPLNGGISRPRSVDSAVRHTYTNGIQPADDAFPRVRAHSLPETSQVPQAQPSQVNVAPPSTPVVKKKAFGQPGKKTDMLTPLSAARAIITPSANDKKRAFAFITHSQETFPTKEPKIDNAPLARRKRRRTSTQELNILQAEFELCSAPDKKKRQELAERCNMSEKAVQIWFQNRRQAIKKQKNAAANKTKVAAPKSSAAASDLTAASNNATSTPAKPFKSLANHNAGASSAEPSMADLSESFKENIPVSVTESTPISSKSINTPQSTATKTPLLRLPKQEQKEQVQQQQLQPEEQKGEQNVEQKSEYPEKSNSQGNFSPTHLSQQKSVRRGQALTFHLTSDKKVLTPIRISPNNRVNKLINGTNAGSPCKRRSVGVSPSASIVKMELTPTKKNLLKDLNTNTMVH